VFVTSYLGSLFGIRRTCRWIATRLVGTTWSRRGNRTICRDLKEKKWSQDTRTFHQVLQAWLTKASIVLQTADRAEAMLSNMSRLGGVKPDGTSFQYALDCQRRSRSNSQGPQGNVAPARIKHVVALLDGEYRRGGLVKWNNDSYLGLRQGWVLLSI
jgi:hypothetical protein